MEMIFRKNCKIPTPRQSYSLVNIIGMFRTGIGIPYVCYTGFETDIIHSQTVKDRRILIVKDMSGIDLPGLIDMNIISQCVDLFFFDVFSVNRIEAKTRVDEVKGFARMSLTEDLCNLSILVCLDLAN